MEKKNTGSRRNDPVLYCHYGSIRGRRQEKVERHKKLRQGKGFITIESPKDVGRVEKTGNNKLAVLLECVSNLTANEMFGSSFGTELEPDRRTEALAEKICADIAKIDEAADFSQ